MFSLPADVHWRAVEGGLCGSACVLEADWRRTRSEQMEMFELHCSPEWSINSVLRLRACGMLRWHTCWLNAALDLWQSALKSLKLSAESVSCGPRFCAAASTQTSSHGPTYPTLYSEEEMDECVCRAYPTPFNHLIL